MGNEEPEGPQAQCFRKAEDQGHVLEAKCVRTVCLQILDLFVVYMSVVNVKRTPEKKADSERC
jgi:hypothetical protein